MADELLSSYTQNIESLTMIPSGSGKFEVIANGETIYSKKATGRHAEPGEVVGLFEEKTGAAAVVRE